MWALDDELCDFSTFRRTAGRSAAKGIPLDCGSVRCHRRYTGRHAQRPRPTAVCSRLFRPISEAAAGVSSEDPSRSETTEGASAANDGFRDAVGPVTPHKQPRRRHFPQARMTPDQIQARREAAAGAGPAERPRTMLTFRQEPAQSSPAHASQQAGRHPTTLQSTAQVGPEEVLSWRRNGVQDRVLRRLRKGGYQISGKLDLHGRTLAQAQVDVLRFLDDAAAAGQRCLLIVHGKSASSPVPARLKNCVNAWLRRHPNVNALHSAKPRDGGTGAVYVLVGRRTPAA